MTREEAIEYLDGMKIAIPICNELKELIDERNEAIDMAIDALQADTVMRDATAEERASVQRYIDSISTEAVQVVRCKDCRWWNGNPETMHNNHLCRNWSKFGSINTSADDFCSCGERREP